MRVENQSKATEMLAGTVLLIDEPLCINIRGRIENCSACRDTCQSEALALSTESVEVDENRCTVCGACIPACPAGVLRLSGFSPRRFIEALGAGPEVHIHCTASRDGGGGVIIPCHRLLDARLLSAALGAGVRVFQLHGLDQCEQCPKGNALADVQRLREDFKSWYGDQAPLVDITGNGQQEGSEGERRCQDQPSLSRRRFLRLAGLRATVGATAWLLPYEDEGDVLEEPEFFQVDLDVRRPVEYQMLWVEQAEMLPWRGDMDLPWRTRTISDNCTACMVCARRCPTGALSEEAVDDDRAISFDAALCTSCGLCETLCPEHAIDSVPLDSHASLGNGRIRLVSRRMKSCTGCGRPFVPGGAAEEICQICKNEQELDDEWLAMLK